MQLNVALLLLKCVFSDEHTVKSLLCAVLPDGANMKTLASAAERTTRSTYPYEQAALVRDSPLLKH